ncbi:MAG: glycerol-phosphatase [Actinomycetota bacterium]|nr:glycerol-phosphatase [Actinomycetota bacterium]
MIGTSYDVILFDLDGTIYRGDAAIPHAPESVARIRAAGVRPVFVTNNSSRTQAAVASHLSSLGIPATPDEVETSAVVTATLLALRGAGTAFVIGEEGLLEALAARGIEVVAQEAHSVDAVVVGFDRGLDYPKLRSACLLVERGAALVATNADASFPAADGLWPGAGALLAAVEATTGRTAEVIGKPAAPLLEAARERGGGGVPLVVGDRLDTDIAGALGLGWDSLLVLTGVTARADLVGDAPRPTFVAEDLRDLFPG